MTEGYNIRLQVEGKYLIGVTSDEMSVSPNTKTSIVKEDQGVKQEAITGHTVTFSISGLIDNTGGSASMLDNDDIMALALLEGDAAVLDVTYVRSDGATYEGTGVITGYSESTPASPDEDSTYSLNIECNDLTLST